MMNLGLVIVLVVLFGYASDWLNWRFLNYRITRLLYYVGALVHETSHAILCVLTGAKIREFSVFSSQPHVTHEKSRLPLIGNLLISSAPIFGGLLFLFLINRYVLENYFLLVPFTGNWNYLILEPINLLAQIRLFDWQSWVMLALFINIGAMIGPSTRDIKNVWPAVIILFFVQSPPLVDLGLVALSLIVVNIAIQLFLALCLWIIVKVF